LAVDDQRVARQMQLAQDVAHVRPHRHLGDDQFFRDRFVVATLRNKMQDFFDSVAGRPRRLNLTVENAEKKP
jgi:hypothetical protein